MRRLVIYGALALLAAGAFAVYRFGSAPPPAAPASPPIVTTLQVRPDARWLLAVGDVERFVTGHPLQAADARWFRGHWQILHRGVAVGSLPEFPDYPEMTAWLTEYATRLGIRDSLSQATSDEKLTTIDAHLAELDPMTAASEVNRRWAAGAKSGALLERGARALVQLELQTMDRVEMADPVAGRAWGLVAMAQAMDSTALARESCLLASLLGYQGLAWGVAGALDPKDPVRLFILHEDAQLAALARAPKASVEARYLSVVRAAQTGDGERWSAWTNRVFQDPGTLTLSLLAAGHSVRSFEASLPVVHAVTSAMARELRALGVVTDLTQVLALQPKPSVLVNDFEKAIGELGPAVDGAFLDRDVVRAHYRATFYSSLCMMAERDRQALTAADATPGLAQELAQVDRGPGAEFGRSNRHLAEDKVGRGVRADLRQDLEQVRQLGAPLLWSTFEALRAHDRVPEVRRDALGMASRLDARPDHRMLLALLTGRDLAMGPLSERIKEEAERISIKSALGAS